MVYVFSTPVPGVLALLAAAVAEASQVRRRRDPIEALFNVSQTALGAVASAICFGQLKDRDLLGPVVGELGGLGAMVVAAAVFYLVNTGLVAVAATLQLGSNPLRLWLVTLADDREAQVTMAALGIVAAHLTETEPLMLPALVPPLVLVHRAIRENVRSRRDTHGALAALVEVVELRDPYTAGHSRLVAATARALALGLGLTAEEADSIESAGRVHDLGKVAIDPAVLTKPGKLDPAEWEQIRRHPVLGADVVARFAAYGEGHRLVRFHHEGWDGSGYPDRLVGETIPLGARILSVAGTFDALTSSRPYRPSRSVDEALAILAAGAGRQWDREVVGALFDHLGVEIGGTPIARPVPTEGSASSAAV